MTDRHSDSEAAAEIVIIGGGLGGVAAALGALRSHASVILTEEYDWIGGQMTSQAVPPDEHSWIEQFGCTSSYRELRNGIRDYYRNSYPLTFEAAHTRYLNPGAGLVSKICHEPRVALAVMQAMLAPYLASGQLRLLLRSRLVEAEVDNDRVTSVTVADVVSDHRTNLRGRFVLDATETGALLPLTGTEHITGAEPQEETGERHAEPGGGEDHVQAITICFAVDYLPGETHVIERPKQYERWLSYHPSFWPDRFFSFADVNWRTGELFQHTFHPNPLDDPADIIADQGVDPGDEDLWLYRRMLARRNFRQGTFLSDICLVNWANNDYFEGSIYGGLPADDADHLEAARQLSLSLLYWLQTEAPGSNGSYGYPGLRLRPDIMGTNDGLAMAPYVREARRIKALTTVLEQDIASADRPDGRARIFTDSVGIGHYRIDLHPAVGGRNFIDIASHPFQIPLGALVPIRMRNLLAAGKSIGTSHITNGAYRLHPIEWNIGEVAGILAAYCVTTDLEPQQVHRSPGRLEDFQRVVVRHGVEIAWPSSML